MSQSGLELEQELSILENMPDELQGEIRSFLDTHSRMCLSAASTSLNRQDIAFRRSTHEQFSQLRQQFPMHHQIYLAQARGAPGKAIKIARQSSRENQDKRLRSLFEFLRRGDFSQENLSKHNMSRLNFCLKLARHSSTFDADGNLLLSLIDREQYQDILDEVFIHGQSNGFNIDDSDKYGFKKNHWIVSCNQMQHTESWQKDEFASEEDVGDDDQALTPLHIAVMCNNHNMVAKILESHPNVNIGHKIGVTPAMLAILNYNLEMLQTLLEHNSFRMQDNVDADGQSLLDYALNANWTEGARYLMSEKGLSPVRDIADVCPLLTAASLHNNRALVSTLLEHGAEPIALELLSEESISCLREDQEALNILLELEAIAEPTSVLLQHLRTCNSCSASITSLGLRLW